MFNNSNLNPSTTNYHLYKENRVETLVMMLDGNVSESPPSYKEAKPRTASICVDSGVQRSHLVLTLSPKSPTRRWGSIRSPIEAITGEKANMNDPGQLQYSGCSSSTRSWEDPSSIQPGTPASFVTLGQSFNYRLSCLICKMLL